MLNSLYTRKYHRPHEWGSGSAEDNSAYEFEQRLPRNLLLNADQISAKLARSTSHALTHVALAGQDTSS